MAQYAFGPDEYVVLNAQQVHVDEKKGFGIPRNSELMLTNRNIVFPIKGLTGKVKDYQVYPLSSIRIVDGKPQCRLDTFALTAARMPRCHKLVRRGSRTRASAIESTSGSPRAAAPRDASL